MITKNEITFPSRDGVTTCYAYTYEPEDGNIKGVVQIVHGMQEHMGRYDEFASFLASHGLMVIGEDHLGHGKSVQSEKDYGYIASEHGDITLVRNTHRLKKMIQKEHPGIPFFILGHSMGSFLTRRYLNMYSTGVAGAIIIGTGGEAAFATRFGIILTYLKTKLRGSHSYSKFLDKLSFGSYQKRIKSPKSSLDWLCTDEGVIRKYEEDALCGLPFTVNGYSALFKLVNYTGKIKNSISVRKDLPILIASGAEDPVGKYGKMPARLASNYLKLGINDVTLQIYPEMRHEILNETERELVYADILAWIVSHMV